MTHADDDLFTYGRLDASLTSVLYEIEDRHRRVQRAYNRLLLGTLALACVTLGAVPAVAVGRNNPWWFLLVVPAIAIPLGAQSLGFRIIERRYHLR